MSLRLVVSAAVLTALAGCVETTTVTETVRLAPASDESACLAAVAAKTNNSVSVLSSSTSEANNMVMVGVGPDRAPWKCLINGGTVVEVMSMVDEGSL